MKLWPLDLVDPTPEELKELADLRREEFKDDWTRLEKFIKK